MAPEEMAEVGVRFWVLDVSGVAQACGALKPLPGRLVEVKSVHVSETVRGRGLSRKIMEHLIEVARADGHRAMVLETGSPTLPAYDAARGLYERLGFSYRGPFGDYAADPLSSYMTLDLSDCAKPGI